MCLFKQGEIWWYEFTLEGKRYRSSTCTTDKDLALRVESEHHVSMKQIGKRDFFEHSADGLIDDLLVALEGAARLEIAEAGDFAAALGERHGPFDRGNHFHDGNLVRIAGQDVAALDATIGNKQAALQQLLQELADG